MFIDQLSNVGREIGQADQKVGASAYERLNDLMKEWTPLKTEAEGSAAVINYGFAGYSPFHFLHHEASWRPRNPTINRARRGSSSSPRRA